MYDLTGVVALVTGAGGDIGREVAVRLAASCADVALLDLPVAAAAVERTAERCEAARPGVRLMRIACDVTDEGQVDAAVAEVTERLGVPRAVFANAGVQGVFAPAHDYPVEDARRVLDVNVIGVLTVLKATSRAMIAAGTGGSVACSASMAGVGGAANMVAYSASKAAVIGLVKAAARDLAPFGVRVTAVSPAFIGPGAMWERQTELQAAVGAPWFADDPEQVGRDMVASVPLRRLGSLEEVAASVVWLLSDESSYVTGENLLVTGGIV